MSRIATATVAECLDRAGYYCEACGGHLSMASKYDLHHRSPRGRGGAFNRMPWIDTPVNLMVIHAGVIGLNCHTLTQYSIHQNPERSKRLWHSLELGTDPNTVPGPTVTRDLRSLRA